MNTKEFEKKWGETDPYYLSDDELIEFKNDCFSMYEETGFIDRFNSPYDDLGGGQHEHNGMKFDVIRRATVEECDIEAMPIWLIKFDNGDEAYCYPEEICKIEHEGVGV